jgi:hypothetical protein
VHAVSFPIDGDVEAGGRGFVEEIAAVLSCAHVTAKLRVPEGLGTTATATPRLPVPFLGARKRIRNLAFPTLQTQNLHRCSITMSNRSRASRTTN